MGGLYTSIGGFNNANQTVYNAAKAAAYEDLDLSTYVGQKSRLVVLRIYNNTGGALQVITRKNGDTSTHDGYSSNIAVGVPNGNSVYIICPTDDDGVLEWYSSSPGGTVVVILIGYI